MGWRYFHLLSDRLLDKCEKRRKCGFDSKYRDIYSGYVGCDIDRILMATKTKQEFLLLVSLVGAIW